MTNSLHGEQYRVSELIRLGSLRLKYWDYEDPHDPRQHEVSVLLDQAKLHLQRREFAQSLQLTEAIHALLDELRNSHHVGIGATKELQMAKERLLTRPLTSDDVDVLADILMLERAANALRLEGLEDEAGWMITQAQRETQRLGPVASDDMNQ